VRVLELSTVEGYDLVEEGSGSFSWCRTWPVDVCILLPCAFLGGSDRWYLPVSFTLVGDRGAVRSFKVSMVAIFLPLLVVCPQSPCGELRGCVLVVVGWRLRVKRVCFLLRAHTPLKQKEKKICTGYQSCCRTRRILQLLKWDNVVYTIPCIWIPASWNATLSSVSPSNLWTVRAHECLIRNCFWIFSQPVFIDVDTGFDIHKTGVQSLPVFELYR
jgi:hypothetical protein